MIGVEVAVRFLSDLWLLMTWQILPSCRNTVFIEHSWLL